jgi:hypothetical protein
MQLMKTLGWKPKTNSETNKITFQNIKHIKLHLTITTCVNKK